MLFSWIFVGFLFSYRRSLNQFHNIQMNSNLNQNKTITDAEIQAFIERIKKYTFTKEPLYIDEEL